jgi:hypothetical protein
MSNEQDPLIALATSPARLYRFDEQALTKDERRIAANIAKHLLQKRPRQEIGAEVLPKLIGRA